MVRRGVSLGLMAVLLAACSAQAKPVPRVLRLPETFAEGVRFKRSSYRLWLPAR